MRSPTPAPVKNQGAMAPRSSMAPFKNPTPKTTAIAMHSAAIKNSIVLNSSFLVAVCHRCHKGNFGESKKFHGSHHTIAVGFMQPLRFLQRNSPAASPTGKSYAPKEAFRKFPYTPFFDPLPEARNPIQKNPKAAVEEAV
ncbi:MAG: hypothetical protein U0N62_01770 [Hydrogeniiclostridium sp.]